MCNVDKFNKIFAKNMRARRKELHLSQEKLGQLCHLHRTYIGGIEQLKRNPSIKSIEKIAVALDTTVDALLNPNYTNLNSKYTLCIKKDDKFKFLPIDEKELTKEQIDFLENIN